MKKSKKIIIIIVASIFSLALAAGWVHFAVLYSQEQTNSSYICSDAEVEKILRGILQNNAQFANGADADFTYKFDCTEYAELKEKYSIEEIAGSGTELEKSCRLIHEFSSRLAHGGSFSEDGIGMNSLELLEYTLDKPQHTINCRCKSQIFGEMCLSLGIYARKVWIMPYSQLDDECHVVTEIYDTGFNKWVLLDFTNELYFTDENGTPLNAVEIRNCLINDTPMKYMSTKGDTPEAISDSETLSFKIYYLKNTAYFYMLKTNCFGETYEEFYLIPEGVTDEFKSVIVGGDGTVANEESLYAKPF